MTDAATTGPRTFISYSWSSPTHESWVVTLAERLMQDGIDVILDKWDLKPGHDANVFMEQMVTDAAVTKVLMICDKAYVEKANQRAGGVGTESQIISPQLYENNSAQQNKFAALCTEVDENGKAYAPVFYKGRIHFDFTLSEREEAAYEELLRWLADKPRYLKPKLGALPASINNPELATTVTLSRARRAEDALRNSLGHAQGALSDYFEGFIAELPSFRVAAVEDEHHDDVVMAKINAMRPYAAEFHSLVGTLLRYQARPELFDLVLDALEKAGSFMFRPESVQSWNSNDFDGYIVLAQDLFLATFANALKAQRFDLAQQQVDRRYVISNENRGDGRASHSFKVFCGYPRSFEARKSRLQLNRASLLGDLYVEWHKGTELGSEAVIQADFVLWLISRAQTDEADWNRWYPSTIVHSNRYRPFEIFARAESKRHFDKLASLLRTTSADDFRAFVQAIDSGQDGLRSSYMSISSAQLSNAANLAALP